MIVDSLTYEAQKYHHWLQTANLTIPSRTTRTLPTNKHNQASLKEQHEWVIEVTTPWRSETHNHSTPARHTIQSTSS